MSWRTGAQLFQELWPLLQQHIPRTATRQEFLVELLPLFLERDVDPESLAELHSDILQALNSLGIEVAMTANAEDDVACCIRQLVSPVEQERINAAQAIEDFAQQADHSEQTVKTTLLALAKALQDTSVKVRRVAAKSISSLVADYALPNKARQQIEVALADKDDIVCKHLTKCLKRSERSRGRKVDRTTKRR